MRIEEGKRYIDGNGDTWGFAYGVENPFARLFCLTRDRDGALCMFKSDGTFWPTSRDRVLDDWVYDLAIEHVDTPPFCAAADPVTRPAHYTGHPSGVECIQITEHLNFCRGNAVKYIWRAGEKGDEIEDLQKAAWYIAREIERLKKIAVDSTSVV